MAMTIKNNVSSNSNISIPHEFVDFILDFLHDDVLTLRACSRVSRAFIPSSRHHIYNVFIVHVVELDLFRKYSGQLYQCRSLAELFEHSPHVAPLVTRFGIPAMSEASSMTGVFTDASLFPIIQSLHNLSQIEVMAARNQGFWSDLPLITHRLFLTVLCSLPLKTLTLKGFDFDDASFEDVFTAAANPALKHLSLVCHRLRWSPQLCPPARPLSSGLPALESLSISEPTTSHNISCLLFIQSLYCISGI